MGDPASGGFGPSMGGREDTSVHGGFRGGGGSSIEGIPDGLFGISWKTKQKINAALAVLSTALTGTFGVGMATKAAWNNYRDRHNNLTGMGLSDEEAADQIARENKEWAEGINKNVQSGGEQQEGGGIPTLPTSTATISAKSTLNGRKPAQWQTEEWIMAYANDPENTSKIWKTHRMGKGAPENIEDADLITSGAAAFANKLGLDSGGGGGDDPSYLQRIQSGLPTVNQSPGYEAPGIRSEISDNEPGDWMPDASTWTEAIARNFPNVHMDFQMGEKATPASSFLKTRGDTSGPPALFGSEQSGSAPAMTDPKTDPWGHFLDQWFGLGEPGQEGYVPPVIGRMLEGADFRRGQANEYLEGIGPYTQQLRDVSDTLVNRGINTKPISVGMEGSPNTISFTPRQSREDITTGLNAGATLDSVLKNKLALADVLDPSASATWTDYINQLRGMAETERAGERGVQMAKYPYEKEFSFRDLMTDLLLASKVGSGILDLF